MALALARVLALAPALAPALAQGLVKAQEQGLALGSLQDLPLYSMPTSKPTSAFGEVLLASPPGPWERRAAQQQHSQPGPAPRARVGSLILACWGELRWRIQGSVASGFS